MSQLWRFKYNFDNNDDGDKTNADLVDADSLIFVGEVTSEKIQGGRGGVDLHCALQYLGNLGKFPVDKTWKRQTNDFLSFGIECDLCKTLVKHLQN